MKSMTIVNRAQLTPLKADHRDKAKQEMTFEMMAEKKNAKTQKLNPIAGMDSAKYFWSLMNVELYLYFMFLLKFIE